MTTSVILAWWLIGAPPRFPWFVWAAVITDVILALPRAIDDLLKLIIWTVEKMS